MYMLGNEYIVKKNGRAVAHSTTFTFVEEVDVIEIASSDGSKDYTTDRKGWRLENTSLLSTEEDVLSENDVVEIVFSNRREAIGGEAICKSVKVVAKRGNLCKWNATFKGTGAVYAVDEVLIWDEGTWDDYIWV